ncbi:MAG: hypothetical protein ABWX73_09920 [Marmoricola sp.]
MPLAANVTIDDTTWAALALVLTVLGAGYTWISWRRRGAAAALRGLAWTLIPIAAWLTGTLRLAANILEDVIDWAAKLVFSPVVWLGIIVAAVAALLWVASGVMRARGIGVRGEGRKVSGSPTREVPAGQTSKQSGTQRAQGSRKRSARTDDDIEGMDDVEAILKKYGI